MRRTVRKQIGVLVALLLCGGAVAGAAEGKLSDAAVRRMAVLRAAQGTQALPPLVRALEDEDVVVRRTAARCLGSMGAAALPALQEALANSDALVRRIAAQSMAESGAAAIEPLSAALKDKDPLVRHAAVIALAGLRPRSAKALEMLTAAQTDESPLVAEVATHAAGEHDVGLSGWDKPFRLDVTRVLTRRQDNQITVRVHNAKMAGGIWKPVSIVALELRE